MKKIIFLFTILAASLFQFSFQQEPKTGLNVGDKAPEINLPGTDGKLIALSSLKGKMVLIDFWASWSGPCRTENPNLVVTYNKFSNAAFRNGQGFEIYSVSLDNQKEAWTKAIQKDNLYWKNHVSDLKWYYGEAVKTYGINNTPIPATFLVDGDGIIIAKNLVGRVLDSEGKPTNVTKLDAELAKLQKQP